MKRFLPIILCAILLLSLAAFAFTAGNGYADGNEDEWYAEAVAALREKGIMDGVGDSRFDPDGIFTRAQLATVLYRLADKPTVVGEDGFTDTDSGKWYSDAVSGATPKADKDSKKMLLKIEESEVPVTWEDNPSVEALRELLPLTIKMSMYGGFEQVGNIGQNIARNDTQITADPGDIVLYSGNQIVIFYGSNSWAYTRLGHVDLSPEEMTAFLGKGNVTITIAEG